MSAPKQKRSFKKPLLILGAIVVLLLIGAGGWYLFLRESGDLQQAAQETDAESTVTLPSYQGLPDKVAYAYRNTAEEPFVVYTRPATGGERVEVMTLEAGSFISQSTTHGNKVALVIEPGATSTSPTAIWVSQDSGASYTKIYEGAPADPASGIGTQITSLVFSHDESVLLAGVLDEAGGRNKVTEIPLDGSASKVVFESEQAGVFLEGYNRQSQQIVYFEGCYNCDGNRADQLLLYNGKAASREVLRASSVGGLMVAVKPDFARVLVAEGQADAEAEGLGVALKPPYQLTEIDLASNQSQAVHTTNDQVQSVGYTITGEPYFVSQNAIQKVAEQPSTVFETMGTILYNGTYFVGDKGVIVAVGEFSDFLLNYVQAGSDEPVTVLAGDANAILFGVTIQ